VNDGLHSADAATIRMLAVLGAQDPDAMRVAAITEFWNDEAWNAAYAREDVSVFVHGAGAPTEEESKAFVRALVSQVVCARDPFTEVEGAIDTAVREALLAFSPASPESEAPLALLTRLSEVVTRVGNAAPVFPDASAVRLKLFLDAVENARESLSAGIHREQGRRGIQKAMGVGPQLRLK
jgi:hypothetical protein